MGTNKKHWSSFSLGMTGEMKAQGFIGLKLHLVIVQLNKQMFLLFFFFYRVDWDSATFPGHLLPTPTFEWPSNERASSIPYTSGCCVVIGCSGQCPEREAWALRIFRNIFLLSVGLCCQHLLPINISEKPVSFSLCCLGNTHTHTHRHININHR